MGTTVTRRIKEVKQPRGGFIKPKEMIEVHLENEKELNPVENIKPNLIGLVIDYLSRFMVTKDAKESFKISINGAMIIDTYISGFSGLYLKTLKIAKQIKGLDDKSIIAACKLVTLDVGLRADPNLYSTFQMEDMKPDANTIENVRIMVKRTLSFFENYGPVTKDGFTFRGGYTETVSSGDGDFLTEDTLWDMKVSKNKPTSGHTLQILMYYLMGKESDEKDTTYKNISKLGLFNPRLNNVYTIDVASIDDNILETVKKDVIGY